MAASNLLKFVAVDVVQRILSTPVSPPIPPDPIGDFDFPDPAAMFHDGIYYAFGGCSTMQSKDLSHWSERRNYLAFSPAWAVAESGRGERPSGAAS